jgi:hypothetical protein
MPLDSTKTLDDLREEVSFHVGGVKNPRFLFPAKKNVDVRREVVRLSVRVDSGMYRTIRYNRYVKMVTTKNLRTLDRE